MADKRMYIPGSEWLYFKLYTGTKTADLILKNELYAYVCELMQAKVIDQWFFIRYTDPDFHIRLRIHLHAEKDFNLILKRFYDFCTPLIDDRLVWNIQCDTYQREMERYGHNTIDLLETFFFTDSDSIVRLLQQLNEENPELERWKLALVLIDSLLSAFSYQLPERKELLYTMAEEFKREYGFTHRRMSKQLNDKYRSLREEINLAMLWENEESRDLSVINSRRQAIARIATQLYAMEESGLLEVNMKSLLSGMIHMCMNRWFRSRNRVHEMVIYEFLSKYYASEMAKNKSL